MIELPTGMNHRATRLAAPASPPTLVGDLEELRCSMLRRLDALEALARQCGGPPEGAAGLDQEASRCRALAEQLESDRQLLAEAWERLERERLEAGGHRPAAIPAPAPTRVHAPAEPAPAPAAANPVAESILRQFQTLCSDVRRTTDRRFSSR